MAAKNGAAMESFTKMVIVSVALETGEPLSVTRKVTRFVLGTSAWVGVQVKRPVLGLMLAPAGALASKL
jgi:hypothetical protein